MPHAPPNAQTDATLDPLDWEAFRVLAHRMLADMLASGMNAHLAGFNDAPRLSPSGSCESCGCEARSVCRSLPCSCALRLLVVPS